MMLRAITGHSAEPTFAQTARSFRLDRLDLVLVDAQDKIIRGAARGPRHVPVEEERSTASKVDACTAKNAVQGRDDLLD